MLGLWAAAALACLLGVLAPAPESSHATLGRELVDLVRVGSTAALAIALLLGPGILCLQPRALPGDGERPDRADDR